MTSNEHSASFSPRSYAERTPGHGKGFGKGDGKGKGKGGFDGGKGKGMNGESVSATGERGQLTL